MPRVPDTRPLRLRERLRRSGPRVAIGSALIVPAVAALAVAQSPAPATLDRPATTARIGWTVPATITEDQRISVPLVGEIDGQATGHVALLENVSACPASPLYPRQIAAGTRLVIAAAPTPPTTPAPTSTTPAPTSPTTPTPTATPDPTPQPTSTTPTTPTTPSPTPAPTSTTSTSLGGLVNQSLSVVEKNSGTYHLCGWVVASPASSEASTVAQLDQRVVVANRTASITAEIPDVARSGDYFSVKVSGTSPGAGRRLLAMAETDRGQQCGNLRKAASGKRPLQTIAGIPSGAFTKVLRLRYRTKTAGPHLLCVQVVEASDRNPEGTAAKVMTVTESIKCVNTQAAITQRRKDLEVIRGRRDAAQERLSAARKRLAPVRAKYLKAKRASDRRVATARKAVRKAKSAAGKRKARQRLARVQRTESRRLRAARRPYAKLNAQLTVQERTYRQYRTGASLLSATITRMQKDTKKYCAKPAR